MKHKALSEPKPQKAFRDKYLAAYMMVAALLLSLVSSAQLDSAKYSPINGYGFKYKRMVFDSVLMIPRSTSPHVPWRAGAIRYNAPDSTLQLWTGIQWLTIGSGGGTFENMANASLMADGDYNHNWNHFQFYVDSLSGLRFMGNEYDVGFTNNRHSFLFEHSNDFNGTPLKLDWSLKRVTGSSDSVGSTYHSDQYETAIRHFNQSNGQVASFTLAGNTPFPAAVLQSYNGGSKTSYLTIGNSIVISAADSIQMKLLPAASADSVVGIRNLGFGLNTLVKVPAPSGGGSTTLNNVGTGYALVATPGGNIKRINPNYGIIIDSTTTANTNTVRVDTSSTNHVITQSDLNDTAAVLRAAIGSGGGSGEANTASNQGSGVGLYKTKTGVDLEFKSLTSPYGIIYTGNTNDVAAIPDTASSNGIATRNKLNDTARTIRARYNTPRTEPYGVIYHKDKFTTASDLTPVGTFSGIYNTGAIGISGGDGTFNNYATIGGYTLLPQWSITTRRKVNVVNGTSYGFGQGVKSTNTNGMFDVLGRIETATGTAGNLVLNNSSGTPLASGAGPSISAGDEVELTITFNDSVVTLAARNITTSSSTSSISYTYSTSSPSGIYVPNTSKFALYEFGGSDSLKSIDIRSATPRNPNVLYLTDSKGIYFAQYWATRTGKLLNANYPTVVSYNGGSDGTVETLAKLPEITRLNPSQVILNIGSNRLRFGGTLAQTKIEYDSVVKFFTNANIPVYHVVLPEDSTGGGIGMSTFKQWVAATYASNYIDVWTQLSTSNILKLGYKGDDVHPNQAAMKSIDSLITVSGKLVNTNDRTYQFRTTDGNIRMVGDSLYFAGTVGGGSGSGISGLTTNAIPKATSSTTIGDGSITDGASLTTLSNAAIINSTFKAGASTAADDAPITVANPSTLPSLSFYRAASGTDEKIWNWYVDATNMYMRTVNDAKNADATAVQFHRSGNSIDYVRLNGNVGIGKTPSFKLDVDGAGYFNGNVTNIGLFTTTGSGAGFAVHRRDTDANAWGIVSMAGGLDFYDQGVADFRFNILSNGKLHIYDTVRADARMSYNSNVHGSFTRYSLVDKAYVDSVVAAVSGGGLSGSGTSGRVAYWNGGSSLTSDANHQYSASDGGTLSVGTSATAGHLNVGGNKNISASGAQSYFVSSIYTDNNTSASGTAPSFSLNYFGQPTMAATNSSVTFPNVYNVYIEKPAAGTNGTITNGYSLYASGPVQLAEGLQRSYSGITTNTTLNKTYDIIGVSAASGNVDVTLPTASANTGLTYTIKRTDNSGNTVTVIGTIDGATNYTGLSAQYKYVTVVSNGTNWYIVANN